MQHIIRFLLREVAENTPYELGSLKSLEWSTKHCLEYKTYSLLFDLVTELASLYEQHNHLQALNISELLLLNLLPKRHQGGLEQLRLFYHQYFNQKKDNTLVGILNRLSHDRASDSLVSTLHYLNLKLQMPGQSTLPYVLR